MVIDKELLIRLRNELALFDPSTAILVSYDHEHGFIYRQLSRVSMMPYLRYLYLNPEPMKYGILTPSDLSNLINRIDDLLELEDCDEEVSLTSNSDYKISLYRFYPLKSLIPIKISELELISFKGRLKLWIYRSLTNDYKLKSLIKNIKLNKLNKNGK